ncbi:hypothetical protein WR25_16395 [Diploscapter pachys]|uniref:Uncharacterized protein n=1 Tax=Diploscapter pachys TaxID=2018661 RepID=A0A2A2K9A6_9BILA|nr:hypothetical protein WR25_16395 [Diploscapter pachys]
MTQPATGTTVATTGSRLPPSTTLSGNPCDTAATITASSRLPTAAAAFKTVRKRPTGVASCRVPVAHDACTMAVSNDQMARFIPPSATPRVAIRTMATGTDVVTVRPIKDIKAMPCAATAIPRAE